MQVLTSDSDRYFHQLPQSRQSGPRLAGVGVYCAGRHPQPFHL